MIEQHHVCLELSENKKIIKAISFVQRLILDHVDKADLLTYRDIQINTLREGTQVCRTLAQSTHLARRVRSFNISSIYSNLRLNQLCLKPDIFSEHNIPSQSSFTNAGCIVRLCHYIIRTQ